MVIFKSNHLASITTFILLTKKFFTFVAISNRLETFSIVFQKLIKASVKLVQRYLPEPFVFAIILTILAFILAMPICKQTPLEVLTSWGNGVWGLLAFSMQMALVLVCGSVLADTSVVKRGLRAIARIPKTPMQAIAVVTFVSSLACWINWGFGLIVGVLFAKEIAKVVKGVDYRLLIASAYSGFVVWHSGISGSIPLAMATEGQALAEATRGCVSSAIPINNTIFSLFNLLLVALVVVALTVVNTLMHPKKGEVVSIDPALLEDVQQAKEDLQHQAQKGDVTPATRLERSRILTYIISLLGLTYLFIILVLKGGSLNLNNVIMLFLFLGLLLHKTPIAYVKSLTRSASSCAGILLQFPFYAGIMGIMTGVGESGLSLAGEISNACVAISTPKTFPILSFLSAGIVNIFVPSGGGQWAVQAPIMIPAGVELGVSPAVTGMAIAWGDAWTNLIQPFWAIPALAIAKLGAKDIMGFCLIDLLVVCAIIIVGFTLFV